MGASGPARVLRITHPPRRRARCIRSSASGTDASGRVSWRGTSMMLSRFSMALALLALASAGTAADGKKPRLDLRASPRIVFSPARVLLTAELVGGEPTEDYHCPGVDWDWGDGTHSFHEEDCPPFAPGMQFERRFTAS